MKQVLILLILICTAGLYSLEVSQVNPVADTTLNVPNFNPIFKNVDTEGNLAFYDVSYNGVWLTVWRVVLNSNGETISNFSYTLLATDLVDQPQFFYGTRYSNYTNLYLRTVDKIAVLRVPDLSLDTNPELHIYPNYGIDFNWTAKYQQLGNTLYYVSNTDHNLYAINSNNYTESIALAYTEPNFLQIALLGNEFLFVYSPLHDSCNLVNLDGEVTQPVNLLPEYLAMMDNTQPNIGDIGIRIYPASWSDGLLRYGYYGFIELNNGQIRFVGLSEESELPIPFLTQTDCIPLGDQRFVCIEQFDAGPYLKTYHFENDQFVDDSNFPYINPNLNYNMRGLFKTSDRYIVGIAMGVQQMKRFICIDFQDQTVQGSLDTPGVMTPSNYEIYYGADHIYSIEDNIIRIYAVERVTGTSDNTQTPIVTSARSYPNPFSGNTEIVVKGASSKATTSIYNIKGQLVRKLSSSENTATDMHFTWDGKDQQGKSTPAGIYLYRVDGNHKISGKMVKME